MAKGIASVGVILFSMSAACGALCQQRPEKVASSALPDAPSIRASEPANVNHTERFGYLAFYKEQSFRNDSRDFFSKHLYPTLLTRNVNYHPVTGESLMDRATYAASRTLVTRDESGKGRLNTGYLLRVLSSTALHTASVPYWRRTASALFSDFGSTIGNDAGMNILHEFEPGIGKLLKGHTPKFLSAIEERIGHK